MCGLVGTIGPVASPVFAALEAIAHRGPDGAGELSKGRVWLGHRRLSVIDLSPAASQPMTKPGAGTIAFNGEIYDYRAQRRRLEERGVHFDTDSDTEVILRGLSCEGIGFLERLHGMYALAWLEPSRPKLWLARDPAGMKPLYIWQKGARIAFSSEIRSLAKAVSGLGGTIHPNAKSLTGFLCWGAVPEPDCILDEARMVPAGCAAEIDLQDQNPGPVHFRRFFSESVRDNLGEAGLAGVVTAIKAASVRHLEADIPVALFLSGGIDSGILAAELARNRRAGSLVICVQLGSRGTADEPEIVRRLVKRWELPLELVSLDDWAKRLEGILDAYDQPSIDGLNTYLVAGVARELGYKVALSGVGADEVFGGYRHLHQHRLWEELDCLPGARTIANLAARLLSELDDPRFRRIGLLLEGMARGELMMRSWRRLFSNRQIHRLLPNLPFPDTGAQPSDRLLLEQETYLRDTLLRDTDVMGMAHGVEIRAPFLDPQVLTAAAQIGTKAMLARGRMPKWPLREGWREDLDFGTLTRSKTGFSLDLAKWFCGTGRPILEEARHGLRKRGVVDRNELERLWSIWSRRLASGHPAAWVPFFAMIQLEEQFRRWGEPA
jgi:asparagine synthase (glutamine-hydrolysing)